MMNNGHLWQRITLTILGFFAIGFASALMVNSGLGSDPFNLMAHGIAKHAQLQVGTVANIAQGILLIVTFFIARRRIGLGTLLGVFLIGTSLNFWGAIFGPWLHESVLAIRIVAAVVAPCLVGFGVALLQIGDLGMAPNDTVPLALSERQKRFQFRTVRIIYDATQFSIGALIGGVFGFGTIASVALTGPSIQISLRLLHKRPQARTID